LVRKATGSDISLVTEQDVLKSICRLGASDPQTIWCYKG